MVINVVKLQITLTFSSAKPVKRIASPLLGISFKIFARPLSRKSRAKIIIIVETAKLLSSRGLLPAAGEQVDTSTMLTSRSVVTYHRRPRHRLRQVSSAIPEQNEKSQKFLYNASFD